DDPKATLSALPVPVPGLGRHLEREPPSAAQPPAARNRSNINLEVAPPAVQRDGLSHPGFVRASTADHCHRRLSRRHLRLEQDSQDRASLERSTSHNFCEEKVVARN
ncbi:hypothetical protein THAOC_24179, partial [Thalassiosira oceanica]